MSTEKRNGRSFIRLQYSFFRVMFSSMEPIDTPKKRHRGDAVKAKIPTDSDQRWEWIKYQLRMRGSSLALIAKALDIPRQSVANAKRVRYPRVERAIARKLDMAPRDIWPDRWHPDGAPLRERPNMGERKPIIGHKPNESNAIAHCQIARSA